MKRLTIFALLGLASLSYGQDPVLGGQLRMSVDNASNSGDETSASTSSNGLEIIGGFNDYRTDGTIKAGFGVSSDGGATWAHILVRPPVANQTTVEGDPMACYDARTNTLFAGAIAFGTNGGVYLAKKVTGSNSFLPAVMCRVSSGADKEWVTSGIIPGNPNSTRLTIAYNEGVIRSDDLGSTWTSPFSLGSGLGFLPRTGPNGEVYVTYWDTSFGIKLRRSLDGGLTWQPIQTVATRLATWGVQNFGIPGNFRNPPIHTMAVNPVNGHIVIMWFDQTEIVSGNRCLDFYMSRSTDQGASWSAPTRLPFRTLGVHSDMIYPWIEFTREGRMHLLGFDTSYNPGQTDGIANGLWNQSYYYTDDEGTTWSNKFRLTPASWGSLNDGRGSGTSFLGDYEGIGFSKKAVFPVYPDTHTNQAEIYTNKVYNPIEIPVSYVWRRGSQTTGTIQGLYLKDGNPVTARPGLVPTPLDPPVQLETTTTLETLNPTSMRVWLNSQVSVNNLEQRILAKNVTTGVFDVIDIRGATTSMTTTNVAIPTPANYIDGSNNVTIKVTYKAVGLVPTLNWLATVDQAVVLTYP